MDRASTTFLVLALTTAVACGGNDFSSSGEGQGGAATASAQAVTAGAITATAGGGAAGGGAAGGGGPACGADLVCVVPPESGGWDGPVAVYVGNAPPADCPAPWMDKRAAGVGPLEGTIECGMCVCGPASGVGCGAPMVDLYDDTTCTNLKATITAGACIPTNYLSAKAHAPPISGSCPPSGDSETKSPPQWAALALICGGAPAGAACGDGGVCTPAPPAGFRPQLCVTKDGDQTCPDGFPDKSVAFGGIQDTRSCTPCGCGAPAVSCGGTANVSHSTSCGGEPCYTGFCKTLADGPIYSMGYTPGSIGSGQCTPKGGEKDGELAPDKPITVCCTPA